MTLADQMQLAAFAHPGRARNGIELIERINAAVQRCEWHGSSTVSGSWIMHDPAWVDVTVELLPHRHDQLFPRVMRCRTCGLLEVVFGLNERAVEP